MKLKFSLVGWLAFALITHAASHTWTLKSGDTVKGDFVSSGATAVVVKHDGTNAFLKISELSTNDLNYMVLKQVEQRQARLAAEAKFSAAHKATEFTSGLLLGPPELVYGKTGWMDAEFYDLHGDPNFFATKDWAKQAIVFSVKDKNGQLYSRCVVSGLGVPGYFQQLGDQVRQLKPGDRVRLSGTAPVVNGGLHDTWLQVQKIEMIESVAERKAKEAATRFGGD